MATKAEIITAMTSDTGWTNLNNEASQYAPGGKITKDYYVKHNLTTKRSVAIMFDDERQVVFKVKNVIYEPPKPVHRLASTLTAAEIITFCKVLME